MNWGHKTLQAPLQLQMLAGKATAAAVVVLFGTLGGLIVKCTLPMNFSSTSSSRGVLLLLLLPVDP
jgi:hypothetical protein